ncbi:heat shock protein-related [Musa troglodytarum]|uniref:Heat shock protein-related n=1 Tax=Musa troglodytarum TaxID=320322 RepID=A0A9E7GJR4_9LILI|nr:heat shock protein-related [Musa troglodytarum]
MRAELSTIQQTLTPEAASVLTRSIAEAARRSHGQTTPLHVAATLLATPSGLLRQACIRSHPQSSHPLQCRALELCFSVALDRIPASNPSPSGESGALPEPPISNALMAALKRAQANQRRGCPELQQQPLLAVKVELEQLLISILDDPSVSRVMREASFSSIAVKAAVEQSISSSTSTPAAAAAAVNTPSIASFVTAAPPSAASRFLGLTNHAGPRHNLYINPRFHQHQANDGSCIPAAAAGTAGDQPRTEEVKRVLDILLRPKKRNPILVGDCNLDAMIKEVLQRFQSSDAQPPLRNTQVLPFAKEIATAAPDHSQITIKIRELSSSIEFMIGGESGVILDLGDLKWLVESPSVSTGSGPIQPPVVSEAGRAAVQEVGRLLRRFEEGCRVWLVGTATCATYLRCQVYHPTMENDWDLQAVPIAQRSSSLFHMFPRVGSNGVVTSSVDNPAPVKGLTGMGATALPLRHQPRTNLCAVCMENYERELSRLVADEFHKHSTKPEASQALPQWLQLAKLGRGGGAKSPSSPLQVSKEEELLWKQSTEELLKKWCETCSRLHPHFHHQSHVGFGSSLSPPASKPSSVVRPHPRCEPKLTVSRGLSPPRLESSQDAVAPPGSPVRTDLVLGSSKASDSSSDSSHKDRLKDFTGCTPDAFSGQQQRSKIAGISDIDTFKRLFQGLAEKVSWQQEAASAVATVVMRCKSGNGKRRNVGSKGDAWLLLLGPDRVGKRKMANALSELVFGTGPTTVSFGRGSDGESNVSCRGRTSMDRIVEAVQRNPFSVVVLEDIDQADMLLQGKVKQAMERGRLPDSYGREVNVGSVIFVLTADWLPEELKSSHSSLLRYEEKILDSACCGWELELSTADMPGKRRPSRACDDDRPTKLRKDSSTGTGLSLDLNLAVGTDAAEAAEGSRNSSDLTTEHEYDKGRLSINCSTFSLAPDLAELVDEAVTFKPVDLGPLRRSILESASVKFAAVMGKGRAIRIDDDALDRIVGGLWLGGASIDDWAERALVPSLKQLRDNLRADRGVVVLRLSTIKGNRAQQQRRSDGDWLPAAVAIAIDGSHDKGFL